jgi:Na+-driven multidrug efflux pump
VLVAEVVGAVVTVASLPVLITVYGIFGAAVASLLGYSTVAVVVVVAISRSTNQRVRSLVLPTWPVTKLLISRGISLLPGRQRGPS